MLKKLAVIGVVGLLVSASGGASAQEALAPTPRRMPRTPVHRETLTSSRVKPAIPSSRSVTGEATIMDTERLKIDDFELRLFGIVPPQLSAPFGPQARAVLDGLTASGAVTCLIRDRDREGRLLATCCNAAGADFALELLRRGLAVSARGSLRPTELAEPYLATEQAAQEQRLGLWSVGLPAAASEGSIRQAMARHEANAVAAAPPPLETAQTGGDASTAKAEQSAQATLGGDAHATPAAVPQISAQDIKAKQEGKQETQQTGAAALAPRADQLLPYLMPIDSPRTSGQVVAEMGFFERYQLLITGLLMLVTVLGVAAAVMFQRWSDKREELRAVAAALRGELMAARAVCLARLRSITPGTDDKSVVWPRIRTLVFQAYVGRIGFLGSVLARQVASIYGQASDYGAYYNASSKTGAGDAKDEPVSKKQALQTLVGHIDEVLPKLAGLEQAPFLPVTLSLAGPSSAAPALPPAPLRQIPKLESKQEADSTASPAVSKSVAASGESKESSPTKGNVAEKPTPLWNSIRKFATERMEKVGAPKSIGMEDHIPDYTAMTEEEELEALSYGGDLDDIEEIVLAKPKRKAKVG